MTNKKTNSRKPDQKQQKYHELSISELESISAGRHIRRLRRAGSGQVTEVVE